jgi:hypothetical protein
MSSRALQREVIDFTVSFEPYVSALVEDIVLAQREAMAEFESADDPAAMAMARDAAAVGVAIALSVIRVPNEFPATLPASSIRSVRVSVRQGRPAIAMHRAYRLGHAVFQDHVFRHAERTGTSIEAVRRITESLFAYYDWVIPQVSQAYEREQAAVPQGGDDPERLRIIERALASATAPDGLGYDLEQTHIAVVLDAVDGPATIRSIAVGLGMTELIGLTPDRVTWGWLGMAPGLRRVDEVVDRLAALIGPGHAGVSEPQAGPHGFVGAHRKALIALRVGLMRDIRVSGYRDVALEALAFGGEDVAADFARAELGRLAEGSNRVATLRETVQEYFAQGSSTAATARSLGIAERTVTYRLRRAEELIGRPVSERRADLETALRLHDVLDIS